MSRHQGFGQAGARRDRQSRLTNPTNARAKAALAIMSATTAVSPRNTKSQVMGLPSISQPHDRTFPPSIIPHICFRPSLAVLVASVAVNLFGSAGAWRCAVDAELLKIGQLHCEGTGLGVARYSRAKTFGAPSPIS